MLTKVLGANTLEWPNAATNLDDVPIVWHVLWADGVQEGPGILLMLHLVHHHEHEVLQVVGGGVQDAVVHHQLDASA